MNAKSKTFGSLAVLPVLIMGLFGVAIAQGSVATFVTTSDSTIIEGVPTGNFGGATTLSVGSWFDGVTAPNRQSGMVDFNVSSLSGQYTSINSITLTLFFNSVNNTANVNRTTQVYEFSAANNGWTESGATWQKQFGTTDWAGGQNGAEIAGTDYVNTLLASNTMNTGGPLPSAGTGINFVFSGTSAQLTTLMNNWVVSMPGFLLREGQTLVQGQDLNRVVYYSRDNGNSAFSPVLQVDYNAVPEPCTAGLLVACSGLMLRRRRAA